MNVFSAGHRSQDDTPPLSLEKFDNSSVEKDSNINGTDDKSFTSTKSVDEHPPEASTNGKYSEEMTSEEKYSPVSEHSDSNVKSAGDQESLPSVPVAGTNSAEVLDSARNRFEQFWGKPNYETNRKESSM